jgi:SHS2 domain-containing protein
MFPERLEPMTAKTRTEEHVGEWKVTITADSLEETFREAARLVARECGPTRGANGDWERVSITARDMATLLADWLNELIGRSEVDGRAYADVRIAGIGDSAGDAFVDAEIRGKPVRVWRSPLKAATYHGLTLDRDGDRLRATVLIDV